MNRFSAFGRPFEGDSRVAGYHGYLGLGSFVSAERHDGAGDGSVLIANVHLVSGHEHRSDCSIGCSDEGRVYPYELKEVVNACT